MLRGGCAEAAWRLCGGFVFSARTLRVCCADTALTLRWHNTDAARTLIRCCCTDAARMLHRGCTEAAQTLCYPLQHLVSQDLQTLCRWRCAALTLRCEDAVLSSKASSHNFFANTVLSSTASCHKRCADAAQRFCLCFADTVQKLCYPLQHLVLKDLQTLRGCCAILYSILSLKMRGLCTDAETMCYLQHLVLKDLQTLHSILS